MMRATAKNRKPKRGWKHRGIVEDARILGVNRNTLYRALTGKWKLPGLVSRYRLLQQLNPKTQNKN